ncbi:hypothetical protein ACKFKF_29125 [Phormidesmis sp. 146-12]
MKYQWTGKMTVRLLALMAIVGTVSAIVLVPSFQPTVPRINSVAPLRLAGARDYQNWRQVS